MKQVIGIPLVLAAIVFGLLYWYTGNPVYVYQAFTLSLVEISMSFDNAVVNEQKLKTMSAFWRQAFFWVGLPIAVLGMRFLIPLLIVGEIEGTGIGQAYQMAVHDPDHFAATLTTAHPAIAGFGGAFLLLTALEFFGGDEKEASWLPGEGLLAKVNMVKGLEFVAVFAAALIAFSYTRSVALVFSSIAGCIVFVAMNAIKDAMQHFDNWLGQSGYAVARLLTGGLGGFLYLEVLDASFSLDGVIAAFAISKNIWVVAAGLGIGAAVIRELTLWMLKTGITDGLKFLPNGAFWSILSLSLSMFVSAAVEVRDWFVALMSIGFIVAAILSSLRSQRVATA